MAFESAPGIDSQRGAYNRQSFAKVQRTRQTLLGEHNGLSDFFVPVIKWREVVAILAVGPFARSRATGAEIQERWRKLTGRQGHPSDPFFAGYFGRRRWPPSYSMPLRRRRSAACWKIG